MSESHKNDLPTRGISTAAASRARFYRVIRQVKKPRALRPGEYLAVDPDAPLVVGEEVIVTTSGGRSLYATLLERSETTLTLGGLEDHANIVMKKTDAALAAAVIGVYSSAYFERGEVRHEQNV